MAIAAHYVPACAPAAADAPEQLELIALGDFDRSNESVAILASDAALRSVALPADTRAAELNSLGDGAYWGSGTLTSDNRLPILLWPIQRTCALARFEAAGSLGVPAGQRIGASERLGALLVAASEAGGGGSLYVDLANAEALPLVGGRGPRTPRRWASVSELGDGLMLAGGNDASGRVLGDAELFEPRLGRFSGESISLAVPRTRHAALALATGSLLIGGESPAGEALGSVELVSAAAPHAARAFELLREPRVAPQAVLLGSSRILVGGGHVRGPAGERQPARSVEFLSTDLTDVNLDPIALDPPALDRVFVALGSGGALAVGGCAAAPDTPPGMAPGASAPSDCIPCAEGCVSRAVWWLDPQGTAHSLDALPLALSVPDPKLVPAAGGSPWLIARGRLGHFDPWLGRFEPVDVGRTSDAQLLADPVAIHPGSFAWLEASPSGPVLVGFYHSQRGPYAQDVAPLLIGSGAGIVPHRPPTARVGTGVRLFYSPQSGLELSGSAAVASVADAEYAAFTLELELASGPPPLIALARAGENEGDAAFGGLECPWPAFELSPEENAAEPRRRVRLRVQRTLDRVRLERLEGERPVEPRPEVCRHALPERVSIRLVGTPAGVTQLTRITLRRSVEP